jgi:hypothetical protein
MRQGALACVRAATLALTLILASDALANPITATMNPAGCDAVKLVLTEELGRGASNPYGPPGPFPIGEEIRLQTAASGGTDCGITQSGIIVTLTNLSANSYEDLVFVAADGVALLNADGSILAGRPLHALRIDRTGINRPLLSESMSPDEVFQPGEIWQFLVISPGYSAIASSVGPGLGGNTLGIGSADVPPIPYHGNRDFSILANLSVPEPGAALLLASGLAVGTIRGRRRTRP